MTGSVMKTVFPTEPAHFKFDMPGLGSVEVQGHLIRRSVQMNPEHISCETDGALLIVTLNRPDKLNAYTGQMGAELTEAFTACRQR